MLIKLAWKNVWRKPKRSLIVIVATLLGTFAGVFSAGLMKGMFKQRLHDAVFIEQADLQIQHKKFQENEDLIYTLKKADSIATYMQAQEGVAGVAKRIQVTGMLNTARGMSSISIVGVDPADEKMTSRLYTTTLAGEYLSEDKRLPIYISDHTAENLGVKTFYLTAAKLDSLQSKGIPVFITEKMTSLNDKHFQTSKQLKKALLSVLSVDEVKKYEFSIEQVCASYRIGSKIVLTFTNINGELQTQLFRVSGIFKTNNLILNTTQVFVNRRDLSPLAGIPFSEVHEIRSLLSNELYLANNQEDLALAYPNYLVRNWKQAAPDAGLFNQVMDLYTYMLMGFILFALIFGIINTMLMSILERRKELGMLMALGMAKRKVFVNIMAETIFLTFIGSLFGMALGWFVISLTAETGIDFGAQSQEIFSTKGLSTLVYPELDFVSLLVISAMILTTAILAAIYPARKALSLNPIEALRTDD